MKLKAYINWPIALCSILLLSVSILVIYSSSKELATGQFIFALVGVLIYFFISQVDLRSIKFLIVPIYLAVIFFLILVLFFGVETRGVTRWLSLGFVNIQPAEFTKPALILFLAKFWAENHTNWSNILKSLLWTLPTILLIFRQPDLGSTLTIVAIWFFVLFASGISIKKVLVILLLLLFVIPISWFSMHDYQRQRIIGFLDPQSDPLGKGYNLIQSQIAVGSGQIFGRGLGRGTQSRLQFLPEFRTDFIFAAIAEELGFVGSFVIISIYLFLIAYCLWVASSAFDRFGLLICFGVSGMLLFQIFVNIGMNIGIVPITGITLPLISYGGSSLIATMLALGFVASVAKMSKRKLIEQI